MKKLAVLVLALLLALGAAAAYAEDVTITWGIWETDNLTAELWQSVIDGFEAENPGIKVEKVLAVGDDRRTFWKNMYNAGNMPDIIPEAEVFKDDISTLFAEVPEDVLSQFEPGALVKTGGTYNMVPNMKQLRMQCYYNIPMFEELGLTEPQTYDDFLNICKALKAAGKVPLICGGTGDIWATGSPWWITVTNQALYNAYPNFNEDLLSGKVKFSNEVLINDLTIWQDLIKNGYYYEGCMSLSYAQAAAEFQAGTAAMMIDGSWAAAGFDAAGNKDFGVFAMPSPYGYEQYCAPVSYYAVYAGSENKDAAWAFIRYFLGGNTQAYRNYLKADGLNSTTKEAVTYEQGPLKEKFVNNWADWEMVPELEKQVGDFALSNDIVNVYLKGMQNIFNGADVAAEVAMWDCELEMLLEDL